MDTSFERSHSNSHLVPSDDIFPRNLEQCDSGLHTQIMAPKMDQRKALGERNVRFFKNTPGTLAPHSSAIRASGEKEEPVQGDHSSCVKPPVDSKNKDCVLVHGPHTKTELLL